jgi:predicted LPLAT superfamily acyltransferase
LKAGRPVGRFLLYPICTYFFASSRSARAASRKYLAAIFERPVRPGQVFRHYLTFSRVILDRVFFLAGRLEQFDIAIEGDKIVEAQLGKNKGCLLLGAHFGSFEALRALGMIERQLPIKILMYPDNSRRIVAVLEALNPALAREMIPLGKPNTMILAKRHVDRGGIIGLLGDRITKGDKLVRTTFLGQPADFPAGPMLLASVLKIPVVLFCGVYLGGNRYKVHFELFADEIVIRPKTRQQDLQTWIDRYAARLDHFCRLAPYNWFNFYDFWEPADGRA